MHAAAIRIHCCLVYCVSVFKLLKKRANLVVASIYSCMLLLLHASASVQCSTASFAMSEHDGQNYCRPVEFCRAHVQFPTVTGCMSECMSSFESLTD